MLFIRLTTTELKRKQAKKDGLEHATNMQKDGPFLWRKTPCGPWIHVRNPVINATFSEA